MKNSTTKDSLVLPKLPEKFDTSSYENELDLANKTLSKLNHLISSNKKLSGVLVNIYNLVEAKYSCEIENIITSYEDLFIANISSRKFSNDTQQVLFYARAQKLGFKEVSKSGLLTNNLVLEMQKLMIKNLAGFRKTKGTVIKNAFTGEIIYSPPQNPLEIVQYMNELETYINDSSSSSLDPLIKMAIIHHRFECIHPFYDGNGRTGRIINLLYLNLQNKLDVPLFNLSKYIMENRRDYYQLLQSVRTKNNWNDWIVYFLRGISQTAHLSIDFITRVNNLLSEIEGQIKEINNLYSAELLQTIFQNPYIDKKLLATNTNISKYAVSKKMDLLVDIEVLSKVKVKNKDYYINNKLLDLIMIDFIKFI